MSISYTTKKVLADNNNADANLLFCVNGKLLSSASELDKAHNHIFSTAIGNKAPSNGELLEFTILDNESKQYKKQYLAFIGDKKHKKRPNHTTFISALAKQSKKLKLSRHASLAIFLDDLSLSANDLSNEKPSRVKKNAAHPAELVCQELDRAYYTYSSTFGKNPETAPLLKRVIFAHHDTADAKLIRSAIKTGSALAAGINFARELGNLPGNHCTPSILADFAKTLAAEHSPLSVKVLGQKALEKLKMGSFLSVARGSDEEGKLIIFEYKGKTSAKPNVIVGKGITFDTGGISLKPGAAMDEMKFDMCGAASVFGTIKALATMEAKTHVIGIVAAAENMPSGCATKPGDVVTSMSGQTIEILNTDAEGRLVLCDALTYAERYKPKSVIDIATLTGACVIALGRHASGLFANDQALADKIIGAGEETGDRVWQMPIWEDYHSSLKSNFADMANIGGREAGSVTAACFLSKFTGAYPWAHVDIAGTGWKSGAEKGATGRPVAMLVNYLVNNA